MCVFAYSVLVFKSDCSVCSHIAHCGVKPLLIDLCALCVVFSNLVALVKVQQQKCLALMCHLSTNLNISSKIQN